MDARAIIIAIVIGLVAGWLASLVVGGGGLIRYVITGLIGSFVGSFLLGALGVNIGISNPLIAQILTAAIGAIVVVLIARVLA
jgi:uncharacterized membrane protein YeaQ/YmgE (transglycosylase-associated protein family)